MLSLIANDICKYIDLLCTYVLYDTRYILIYFIFLITVTGDFVPLVYFILYNQRKFLRIHSHRWMSRIYKVGDTILISSLLSAPFLRPILSHDRLPYGTTLRIIRVYDTPRNRRKCRRVVYLRKITIVSRFLFHICIPYNI